MDSRGWWIVCNVINALTLSIGIYIAWRQLEKAEYARLLDHPDCSVNQMRDLKVDIARDQLWVNGGFLLLGLALIGVAYVWPYFWPLPVPWPIVVGTALFTFVWVGVVARALYYARRLEQIAAIRAVEEQEKAGARAVRQERVTT